MDRLFQITQRHYDIIIKQGHENLPQETGGFLGGKDNVIQAILPMFNKHLYNKTDTFLFTQEDITRAHEFFKKHSLDYYGLYHTHPKGIAYPSKEDIATGHQYHFIISFRDPEKPDFAAFEIVRREPIFIPIKVIDNKKFSPIDIFGARDKKNAPKSMKEEAEHLHGLIEDIKADQAPEYPKMPPNSYEESDFSTFA